MVLELFYPLVSRPNVQLGRSLRIFFVAVLFLCGDAAFFSKSAQATDEPQRVADLLTRLSTAIRERDYRGLFTYEYGGSLQTLRLTHQVIDGIEYEHLEYLNGLSRRVERLGTSVDCLSPAEQVLRGLLPGLDGGLSALSQHYNFYFRGDERIAGRQAVTLQVVPRDEHRYGYNLFIDKLTGLPLGAMTLSGRRRVLERFAVCQY